MVIHPLEQNLDDVKIERVPALKKWPQQDGKNTFASPGRDLVKT